MLEVGIVPTGLGGADDSYIYISMYIYVYIDIHGFSYRNDSSMHFHL